MSGGGSTGSGGTTEEAPKVDLGLLEEDDEFEEFPTDSKIKMDTDAKHLI